MNARFREMIASLRGRRALAAALVSLITLALVGGVILTTTSIGCGPAQQLGLKGFAARCKFSPTALITTPSPTVPTTPGPTTSPPNFITSPPPNPLTPDPNLLPPGPPTATIPDSGPASGTYQPFTPPASTPGPPSLALNCRLPVYVGPSGSGGFIVFPGGTFVADPKSAVTIPSPSPSSTPPPAPPGNYPNSGIGALSYDRAQSRWLPVPYTSVTPDGSRYAHVSPDSIYVENVAGGPAIELGEGHAWTIVGVQNQGVYATIVNEAGLWLLPFSGPSKQITATGFWQLASAEAAYGTATSAVPDGVANIILRLDLKSGAVSDWFTRNGARSAMYGFDASGNALISVSYYSTNAQEVWLTTGPKAAVPIFGSLDGIGFNGPPISDSHGVWIPMTYNHYNTYTQGIALYVPGSGIWWMSSLGTQLAGGCI